MKKVSRSDLKNAVRLASRATFSRRGVCAHLGGRIAVGAGQHAVSCPSGCGIEGMGYAKDVRYLFPAGLDLATIVVN